jgi:predicted CxxxxCH...CXXCH cytochrome family protein
MLGPTELKLHEWEPELRDLVAAFEHVRSGSGRLVVLEGPAGSGKSALTAAARERPSPAWTTGSRASQACRGCHSSGAGVISSSCCNLPR